MSILLLRDKIERPVRFQRAKEFRLTQGAILQAF